ncbi:Glioma pathoproteinsis-related protein 1 [Balamuthia mandrillaris]
MRGPERACYGGWFLVAAMGMLCFLTACFALSDEERDIVLEAHNCARRNKGLPELSYDTSLEKTAQAWTNKCDFRHSGQGGVGENLWASSGKPTAAEALKGSLRSWLSEEKQWNCKTNGCKGVCGHYTQVMWSRTTHVGCGFINDCSTEWRTIITCQYKPPGNYVGARPFSADKCDVEKGCDKAEDSHSSTGSSSSSLTSTSYHFSAATLSEKTAAAVVGAVGGVLLLGAVAGVVVYFHLRKKRKTMVRNQVTAPTVSPSTA